MNVKDKSGYTALQYAHRYGFIEVANMLLEADRL